MRQYRGRTRAEEQRGRPLRTTTRSGPRSDLRASLFACAARAGASCSVLYSTTHQTMPAAAKMTNGACQPSRSAINPAAYAPNPAPASTAVWCIDSARLRIAGPMPIADQRGAGRVIRRLAERDHAAQREQHRETGGERYQARRDAPERETTDDHPRAARAVAEAAEQERGNAVDPEERRVDQREMLGREPELLAQLRHDRDQDRAVRRIQERDHPQQADQDPRVVRGERAPRGHCVNLCRVHCSPILYGRSTCAASTIRSGACPRSTHASSARRMSCSAIVAHARHHAGLPERVRCCAALAVPHARHHEQPEERLRALHAAHARDDPLVVVDAGVRRDQSIRPPEVHQQLSAQPRERRQVGIGRVQHLAERRVADASLLRELEVAHTGEALDAPRRIVVNHVAEELLGERQLQLASLSGSAANPK